MYWPAFYFPAAVGNTSTAIIHESNKCIFIYVCPICADITKASRNLHRSSSYFLLFISLCDLTYEHLKCRSFQRNRWKATIPSGLENLPTISAIVMIELSSCARPSHSPLVPSVKLSENLGGHGSSKKIHGHVEE